MTLLKGCYVNEKYEECIQFCEDLFPDGESSNSYARILKAKSMFKKYTCEVFCLHKVEDVLQPDKLHAQHSKCYIMAKEVVKELGKNYELAKNDEEALRMLDSAMWDVISKTNELNDIQICYLCREKQTHKIVHQQVESHSECEVSEATKMLSLKPTNPTIVKRKLARSHTFPNFILKKFSSGHPLPVGHGAFQQIGKPKHHMKSAKQMTCFMLCGSCESLISSNGEAQFSNLFFDKIYNVDQPSHSRRGNFDIEYGKWLYQFCVGIIFRNLHWHRGYFTNEDELYKLLDQCRQNLLNPDSVAASKPDIYLLISPLHASEEEAKHASGHLNKVLNCSCAFSLQNISLKDGALDQMSAHFLIVHMGVINILVKFSPAADVLIPSEFQVNPVGGTYPVPPEDIRKQLLPLGVWKKFQLIAQQIEVHLRETPMHVDERIESIKKVYYPSENIKETFGMMEGLDIDYDALHSEEGIKPAPEAHKCKKVNLLPSDFKIKPQFHSSTVVLPKNHRILLHYSEWKPENKYHSVLFLCVGNDNDYSFDSPYVIWHHERPGLECSVGFFVSTSDLSATTFLPDREMKTMLKGKSPVSLAPFIERLPQLMPDILKGKGFYCIESLLWKVKMIRYVTISCKIDQHVCIFFSILEV